MGILGDIIDGIINIFLPEPELVPIPISESEEDNN